MDAIDASLVVVAASPELTLHSGLAPSETGAEFIHFSITVPFDPLYSWAAEGNEHRLSTLFAIDQENGAEVLFLPSVFALRANPDRATQTVSCRVGTFRLLELVAGAIEHAGVYLFIVLQEERS